MSDCEYPCPCGFHRDERIDIHLDVMRVPFEKLSNLDGGEPSATIRVPDIPAFIRLIAPVLEDRLAQCIILSLCQHQF